MQTIVWVTQLLNHKMVTKQYLLLKLCWSLHEDTVVHAYSQKPCNNTVKRQAVDARDYKAKTARVHKTARGF